MRHLSLKYESLTVYIYRDICLNKEGKNNISIIVLNYRYQWRAVLIFFQIFIKSFSNLYNHCNLKLIKDIQ